MTRITESATVSAAEAVLTAAKREADHDRYYGEAWKRRSRDAASGPAARSCLYLRARVGASDYRPTRFMRLLPGRPSLVRNRSGEVVK